MKSSWVPAKFNKEELKQEFFKSKKWHRCQTVMDGNCAVDAVAVALHLDRTREIWQMLRGLAMENPNLSKDEVSARKSFGRFLAFEDINYIAMSGFQTTPIIIDAREKSEYLFAFDATTMREFAQAEAELVEHAKKEGEERVYMLLRYNEHGNHFDTFGAKCRLDSIPKDAPPDLEYGTLFRTSQLPVDLLAKWQEQRDLFIAKNVRSAKQSRANAKHKPPRHTLIVNVIDEAGEEADSQETETDEELNT